jgi:phage antirepressor YoqD-like protein
MPETEYIKVFYQEESWISTEDAAKMLGIQPKTLRNFHRQSIKLLSLRYIRFHGLLLWSLSDIMSLIADD